MTPHLPAQLPLPLETLPAPPPLQQPDMPSINPQEVWRTISPDAQTRIQLIWMRVMEEVTDAIQ